MRDISYSRAILNSRQMALLCGAALRWFGSSCIFRWTQWLTQAFPLPQIWRSSVHLWELGATNSPPKKRAGSICWIINNSISRGLSDFAEIWHVDALRLRGGCGIVECVGWWNINLVIKAQCSEPLGSAIHRVPIPRSPFPGAYRKGCISGEYFGGLGLNPCIKSCPRKLFITYCGGRF